MDRRSLLIATVAGRAKTFEVKVLEWQQSNLLFDRLLARDSQSCAALALGSAQYERKLGSHGFTGPVTFYVNREGLRAVLNQSKEIKLEWRRVRF